MFAHASGRSGLGADDDALDETEGLDSNRVSKSAVLATAPILNPHPPGRGAGTSHLLFEPPVPVASSSPDAHLEAPNPPPSTPPGLDADPR